MGKGAALRAGFDRAAEMGFTHAITIDADGQHATKELELFATACRQRPDAFIIGVRDLKRAGAPFSRRATNALSTFWFRFETGERLTDTQCGLPLLSAGRHPAFAGDVGTLRVRTGDHGKGRVGRHAAAAQPVSADYAAPTSNFRTREIRAMSRHGSKCESCEVGAA